MKTFITTIQRGILLLCFTFITSSLYSNWNIPIVNYSPADYNAGTQNWEVSVDKNNWLYAANNFGLLQFDGNAWENIGIWNSSVIRSLCIDEEGNIYVGANNEFGVFRHNNKGTLSYGRLSNHMPEGHIYFNEVWNIHEMQDIVYAQTLHAIYTISKDGDLTDDDAQLLISKDYIYTSNIIRGGLYIAASDGIFYTTGSQMHLLNGSQILTNKRICAICEYCDNKILIATEFDGLYVYDGNSITPFRTSVDRYINQNQLYSFAIGKRHMAFGTVRGGLVYTDLDGQNMHIVATTNGLLNNTVLSLTFDSDDNIYLGLDKGISFVAISSPRQQFVSTQTSFGSGYDALTEPNYFATNQGLYKLSDDQSMVSLVPNSNGQVWHIDQIDGTTYICHHNGLYILENNRFIPVCTENGFWHIKPLNDKYLVAGSYNGYYLVNRTDKRTIQKLAGYDETAYLFEIHANKIYTTIPNHVIELSIDIDHLKVEQSEVLTTNSQYIYLSEIGSKLAISTIDSCFTIYEDGIAKEDKDFFNLLKGNHYYELIKLDQDSNLWFINNQALSVRFYDKKQGDYDSVIYTPIHLSHYFIGGFPNIYIKDDYAIIGNVDGFDKISISELKRYDKSSMREDAHNLCIRQVISVQNNDSVLYGESLCHLDTTLVIAYKDNSLRFVFGNSNFPLCNSEYSVRLKEVDDDYSDWSSSKVKSYSALREGKYTLQVRMRTIEDSSITTIEQSFRILPPWYRTVWAYILWIVILLVIILLIVFFIIYIFSIEKKRIEKDRDFQLKLKDEKYEKQRLEQEKKILQLQNDKTQYELRSKSKELSDLLLNQANKNEFVQDIQRELHKLTDELNKGSYIAATKRVQQLQHKLSNNSQDIDWKRFEENFDMVNDQFIQRLSQKYPWLNKNERKLCVYIHMGLYTKEIAPLLNLSTRGVEMLRYRMRKKMNIDREANLEQYFKQFGKEEDTDELVSAG